MANNQSTQGTCSSKETCSSPGATSAQADTGLDAHKRAGRCALCGRNCQLTFHHLIPRKLHRRTHFRKHYSKEQLSQGIYLCRPCHSGVHKLFDEMTLGKQLNSLSALKDDPRVQKHSLWVAKQRIR